MWAAQWALPWAVQVMFGEFCGSLWMGSSAQNLICCLSIAPAAHSAPLLPNSNAHNSRSSLDDNFKLQTYCTARFLIPAWKCLIVRCRQAAVARIWWDSYVLLGCGRWHGQGLLLHQTKVQSNPRYFLVLEFLHQGIKTHQGTHRTPRINTKDHRRTQLAVWLVPPLFQFTSTQSLHGFVQDCRETPRLRVVGGCMLDHVGVELGSGDLLQRTRAELKEFDIHASIHARFAVHITNIHWLGFAGTAAFCFFSCSNPASISEMNLQLMACRRDHSERLSDLFQQSFNGTASHTHWHTPLCKANQSAALRVLSGLVL